MKVPFPDPEVTTLSRYCLNWAVFSSDANFLVVASKDSSITLVPFSSLWVISFIIWGWIHVPPLATVLNAAIYWTEFTVLVCPKAIVTKSVIDIFAAFFIIPFASPGKSTPEICPKPNFLIYSTKVSLPIFSPSCINPTLHEFWIISPNVWVPCPPDFQHFILLLPYVRLPLQVNVSFSETKPSSIAVIAVITLNIDPGSKVSFTSLFLHIFWSFSPSVSPTKFSIPS